MQNNKVNVTALRQCYKIQMSLIWAPRSVADRTNKFGNIGMAVKEGFYTQRETARERKG